MKKVLLVLIGISFLFACSGKEQAQTQQEFPPCKINGYDCWKIVLLAEKSYQNPKLKRGLTVTESAAFKDGGSVIYTLSNGVTIFKKKPMGLPSEERKVYVTFPNLEQFTFNDKGEMIAHSPAAKDCIINKLSCGRITKGLNFFFTTKQTERCVGDFCSALTDKRLMGFSLKDYQQNGDTHIYTLDDGRTVLFNWEPNSPEHGFLTITEKDGTKKKFNPQGKPVQ